MPARHDRRTARREGQIQSIIWPHPSPDLGFRRQNRAIFALACGFYIAVAFYLRHLDLYIDDAVARTAQAFSVLYSRDPHLGAIGFVWNPLPTLLQLPLITVLHTARLDPLLAGNLLTAICGAAALCVLNRAMLRAGLPPWFRWLLLALYGLNPVVVLYSANGESEALFILLVILVVTSFIEWAETRSLRALLVMTLVSALAVQTRYESFALVAAVAGAIILTCVPLIRHIGISGAARRVESYSLAYLVAPAYSCATWAFFNWTIKGDPLFFLHSAYSNIAATAQFREDGASYLNGVVYSWPGSFQYGVSRLFGIFPAFGAILLLAVCLATARRARSMTLPGVVLISLAIPSFEIAMIERGASFGWLRFFMYGIPFSFLLLIALCRTIPGLVQGRHAQLLWVLISLVVLGSNAASWIAMDTPSIGREEEYVACKILHPNWISSRSTNRDSKEIDAVVQSLPPGRVLLDTYQGFAIPVVSAQPARYVVTSDLDFEAILRHPAGTVRYILVPYPDALGLADNINQQYPDLWERSSSWTLLRRTFPQTANHWKLYEVTGFLPEGLRDGRHASMSPLPSGNEVPEQTENGCRSAAHVLG